MDWLTFKSPVIPVVSIERADQAVPLALALLAGGIDVIEITLRRPGGLPGIERLAREALPIALGAGTLLDEADLRRARDAGAQFGLSPGCTAQLCDAALRLNFPFIPGVMTPGEAMAARSLGFLLLKLFPAAEAGGIEMLKSLHGPLPDLAFCPTGGVRLESLVAYLDQPNVRMVGGSWLAPAHRVEAGDWPAITQLACDAIGRARRARPQSV